MENIRCPKCHRLLATIDDDRINVVVKNRVKAIFLAGDLVCVKCNTKVEMNDQSQTTSKEVFRQTFKLTSFDAPDILNETNIQEKD